MIPQDFIQTLLGRVDIVDVIDRHVKLKKAGSNFQACCPFHNEKTPSFSVSPTKQFYHCFGCGAHGNAIGFLMEYSGQSYPDAIRTLAESLGLTVPEEKSRNARPADDRAPTLTALMMEALGYFRAQLKKSPAAIEYLKKRGLSGEIAARFGMGYAPDGWQNLEAVYPDYKAAILKDTGLVIDNDEGRRYDRFRDRVMFPILDGRGNVIGFGGRILGAGEPKYLNSPETPLFEKGRELYGLYQARRAIRDASQVVVVEGYMDVVALAQHGVENAVATLGTATTPFHVQKLMRLADDVVFCFDGDNAGRKAAWRALEVSLPVLADGKAVSFLFLPPEHDPDTYVREHGREGFAEALAGAKPLSQYLVGELASQVDMRSEEGRARFLAQAKPLVAQIEAPAMGVMLRRRLAEMAGLSAEELAELLPAAGRPGPARPAPAGRSHRQARTLEAKLLARVLLHPQVADLVGEDALTGNNIDADALRAVLAYLRDQPSPPSLGQAEEYFKGTEHEGPVADALAESLLQQAEGPDVDWEPEVRGLAEKLANEAKARRHAHLMRIIGAGTESPAERSEYQALTEWLQAMKSGETKAEEHPEV